MPLILVERLDKTGQPIHRPLWLMATGEDIPVLETLWRLYLKPFCVDHWYRFIKQRLHWCLPQLSTPEQTAGWSDLRPLMSWQLWLARQDPQNHPLPWQKPLKTKKDPWTGCQCLCLDFSGGGYPYPGAQTPGKGSRLAYG